MSDDIEAILKAQQAQKRECDEAERQRQERIPKVQRVKAALNDFRAILQQNWDLRNRCDASEEDLSRVRERLADAFIRWAQRLRDEGEEYRLDGLSCDGPKWALAESLYQLGRRGERASLLGRVKQLQETPREFQSEVWQIVGELTGEILDTSEATWGVPLFGKHAANACDGSATGHAESKQAEAFAAMDQNATDRNEQPAAEMTGIDGEHLESAPDDSHPSEEYASPSLDLTNVFSAAAELAIAIWLWQPSVLPGVDPFDSVPERATKVHCFHLSVALQRPNFTREGWHQFVQSLDLAMPIKHALVTLYDALDWEGDQLRDGRRLPGSLRTAFEQLSDGLAVLFETLPPSGQDSTESLCRQMTECWGWHQRSADALGGKTAHQPESVPEQGASKPEVVPVASQSDAATRPMIPSASNAPDWGKAATDGREEGENAASWQGAHEDSTGAAQAGRKKPIPKEEANILVREYLNTHGNGTVKEIHQATGVSTGAISQSAAWKAHQAKKKSNSDVAVPCVKTRPLTSKMLEAVGLEADPGEQISAEEVGWQYLLENATPEERARLHAMTPSERAEQIRLAIEQLSDRYDAQK
jgi:hypothetical protein